ncbi:MAG: type II toxin-antitoxin system RelE/ParE family toxin [Nitrospirota bacterium]|nr:type II toxin-antitoxin system RelE/ParE family toxin [Nitrospirota bacterium]
MRQVVFRQQARREFDQAGDWYEKERAGLGADFLAEIQSVIDRIASHPEQFPIVHRDVRKAVARRFPFCVYFRERELSIVVLAVFHGSRKPSLLEQQTK